MTCGIQAMLVKNAAERPMRVKCTGSMQDLTR
jgi:hypothetical protein